MGSMEYVAQLFLWETGVGEWFQTQAALNGSSSGEKFLSLPPV